MKLSYKVNKKPEEIKVLLAHILLIQLFGHVISRHW